MELVLYSFFILLIAYSGVLFWLARGFWLTGEQYKTEPEKEVQITIIICARNEEKHVSLCLDTIVRQEYDPELLEIIFINDASTDSTVKQAESILKRSGLKYTLISNATQKGKKQSIVHGMQFAHGELIVTRDADTFNRSTLWLKSISSFYSSRPSDMIIAPVALSDNYGIMWALQAIENNVLVMCAAGSAYYKKPFLCSGANLIFTKKAFYNAGAYATHIHIASGDDVLFLEDLKKIPGTVINYLKSKEATVHTFPCYSISELIQQKTRWASKFKINKNKLNSLLAFLGLAVNIGWLFCFFYGFLKPNNNSVTILFIVCKLLIDFLLLFLTSGFIKNRLLLWFSLPVGCVYPVYAFIVGISSFFIKPKWKT